MSNLDIFNLDADSLITKVPTGKTGDADFYKPYPEDGKDGVYKSLIRFVPNPKDPGKSKIQKFYVFLKDPSTGNGFSVDCPSTVGKKSVLKDLYWKLKNSHSAADQELSKTFSRKEDYYSLIQIVEDKNKPELQGKIMLFKFGKKLNDFIEAQLKPEYGTKCNPYDLFDGKEFSLHVRKVGEWNNYDLCSFVGERSPIKIDGTPMQKNQTDMQKILAYLNEGPQNLTSYEYKDWDSETTENVMKAIRASVPENRVVNEIIGGVGSATSTYSTKEESVSTPSSNDYLSEASDTRSFSQSSPAKKETVKATSSSSLEDLYDDL